jgi:hypothetical protein
LNLHRLSPEGACLVTRELATGEKERYEPAEYQRFLDECETQTPLDEFDATVDEVIASTRPYDPGADRVAAPRLHQALRLSRRAAADPGVWRYLAVVRRPHFVRHRWELRTLTQMRRRFWRPGTRSDSNAYSRLWWIAELTREGDSYALTERVLSRQPLATQLFVRDFCHHRPAIVALVDVLEDSPGDEVEAVVRHFSSFLTTVVLEAQSADAIRATLDAIRHEVRRSL